jgi:hypothetical protein
LASTPHCALGLVLDRHVEIRVVGQGLRDDPRAAHRFADLSAERARGVFDRVVQQLFDRGRIRAVPEILSRSAPTLKCVALGTMRCRPCDG